MVELRIWSSGSKFWFLNHQYHRANGPAMVWDDGYQEWFLHSKPFTEYEHMMLVAQEQSNG